MSKPAATDALVTLTLPSDLQVEGPPVLSFQVSRWTAEGDRIKGAELTLYECDYDDEWSPGRRDPSSKKQVAQVTFDLVRNTDQSKSPRVEWLVTNPKLVSGAKGKDVVLYLGGEGKKRIAFSLAVPRDATTFHDEGPDLEIGWTFKAGTAPPIERLDTLETQSSTITIVEPLALLLGLKHTKTVGRFSDINRNPPVAPADAYATLDDTTLGILRDPKGKRPVDVDGLRFSNFVPPQKRRAVIRELMAGIRIAQHEGKKLTADDQKFKEECWKDGDIRTAYFVLHDIANERDVVVKKKVNGVMKNVTMKTGPYAPNGNDDRKTTRDFAVGRTASGFVNMNGSVVLVFDMSSTKTGGKKPWSLYRWAANHSVAYESFPVCTQDDNDTDKSDDPKNTYDYKHVSIGYDERANTYVKWPTTIIETWAKLYILASARAAHLLTVTTHKEFGQAEHGDPRCFDVQVLYDEITKQLNALSSAQGGSLQLPVGVRYGINRLRGFDPAVLAEGKNRPKNITQPKAWHFPHQSGTWETP